MGFPHTRFLSVEGAFLKGGNLMSLFIDKHNRRKSPFALGVFCMTLMELLLFLVTYAFLLPPVSQAVVFQSGAASWAVQSLIVSGAGTALSCLFFLAPDKRMVPGGFVGLGVVLLMFCAAALMLEHPEDRDFMLRLIFAFGLPPVLVGNAVAWPIYLRLKHANPAPGPRKTVRQELLEAAAREAEKQERKRARQAEKAPAPPEPAKPAPQPPETPEEALFGPESGGGPSAFRSEEEEAMLLYMDDGDEESDD